MFELHARPHALRHFMLAIWAALLAGCVPQAVAPPEGAPSNLAAVGGNATVTLSWSASSGATGYSVRRATTSGGPYTQIAAPASTGHTDSSVSNGTTYYYIVSAFNNGGGSANSAEASATPAIPTIPPTPTNLTATSGNGSVGLSWSASSSALNYRVKRATTSGGPYTQIATPVTTSHTDTPLTNGTTYYYVVSAVNSLGESANSAQVSATPSPPPPSTFGTWINVTPAGVNLSASVGCGNPGTNTVEPDTARPGHLYLQFSCQGIWRSMDYGVSWTGPINTGTNGAAAANCEGGISLAQNGSASTPIVYQSCIRGSAQGLWKSTDGGVNWTSYAVTPTVRQDYLPPAVDPYDHNHLLMTGHEFNSIVESVDGGQSWTSVTLDNGMMLSGQNSFIFFVNTGSSTTTRGNWLWMAGGGGAGTWRTTTAGGTWSRVDGNESLIGATQIYQPDNNGVVFMAGVSSSLGWGVLRSTDYGMTWVHVGNVSTESTVFGTPKNVYTMSGTADKNFSVASQPGTGQWVSPGTPTTLANGAARVAVVNNGTNNILVGAMWESGVWRYVEP
jgi:hypothetical protein